MSAPRSSAAGDRERKVKSPCGRSPRLLGSRLRPDGGAPESAARKRGAGARQVSSRELSPRRLRGRPGRGPAAGTGPLHSGSLFFAGARGRTLRKKHRRCGSVVPPLAQRPALKGLEKAKVGGVRGSRGARAGACGRGGLEGSGEARVAAWSMGSTCGGVTLPIPVGASSSGRLRLRPPPSNFVFVPFAGRSPSCWRGNHGAHARRKLASIGGEAIP